MISRPFPLVLAFALLMAAPLPCAKAEAQVLSDPVAALQELRALDEVVSTAGYRLASGAIDLCAERRPGTGFAIQAATQYPAAARPALMAAFGMDAAPTILAVAPDSPAAAAGVVADDAILSIDGAAPPAAARLHDSYDRVDAVLDAIEAAAGDGLLRLRLLGRDGAERDVALTPRPVCPTRFAISTSDAIGATADGRVVVVTTGTLAAAQDEDEIAAVLAHEFAHNILHHRERLNAAGVARGLAGQFGRNARLTRESEVEADRLATHLVARAGYDPLGGVRFWARMDERRGLLLVSATHPGPGERIATITREAARVAELQRAGRPLRPDFLPPPNDAEAQTGALPSM